MHQKRNNVTRKIPIIRKGSTYVVRAASSHKDSVPVLIAVRDMLKLAHTLKEVKYMIHLKLLKLNGKPVKDFKESIKIFNILEADKPYILKVLPTKRFVFEPLDSKHQNSRTVKVADKKLIGKDKFQLNFHDGSNLLSTDKKIKVGDSLTISFDKKILSHTSLEKGKSVFIISGKYMGKEGKIDSVNGKEISLKISDMDSSTELNQKSLIAI